MKRIISFVFLLLAGSSYAQQIQRLQIDIPTKYDSSIDIPKTIDEGYNMFTDDNFTSLKPQYEQKINSINEFTKKANDYLVTCTQEYAELSMRNDPILQDTSREFAIREINVLNDELTTILNNVVSDLGAAQVEMRDRVNQIKDKNEKKRIINEFYTGKFQEVFNSHSSLLRTKLVEINYAYGVQDYGFAMVNPITRTKLIASLISTVQAFVNSKNNIAKGAAERLARDYLDLRN